MANPNIYILGAGSLGCLWAAHLSAAYRGTVSFLSTRTVEKHLHCFELSTAFDDSTPLSSMIPVVSFENIERIDILLVCTKSYDALPAIETLKETLTEQSQIVLFQNGLGSQFGIIKALPDFPIYAAVTTEGVNRKSVEQVIHAGKGQTFMGALNPAASDSAHLASALKTEHLEISVEDDIWYRLWMKLAINCAINPFTALLNCPNGELQSHELFQNLWPSLRSELVEMLNAVEYAINEAELETIVFDVMDKTRHNISSMLQDARQQKRTEIDDINGFAMHTLKSKQKNYATNEILCKRVQNLSNNWPEREPLKRDS